jgi:hypothetical protein
MQYEPKLYLLNWWRRYLLAQPPKLTISNNLAENEKLTWPLRDAEAKFKKNSLMHSKDYELLFLKFLSDCHEGLKRYKPLKKPFQPIQPP